MTQLLQPMPCFTTPSAANCADPTEGADQLWSEANDLAEALWWEACHSHFPSMLLLTQYVFAHGIPVQRRKLIWPVLLGAFEWQADFGKIEASQCTMRESYRTLFQKAVDFAQTAQSPVEVEEYKTHSDVIAYDVYRADESFFVDDLSEDVEISDTEYVFSQVEFSLSHYQNVMLRILQTFLFKNLFPGYHQGMSDLLEPILAVVGDEALAYHCFSSLMSVIITRFDKTSEDGTQVECIDLTFADIFRAQCESFAN